MGGPGSGAPLTSEYSLQVGFSFNIRLGRNLSLWRNAVLNQDMDCGLIVDGGVGAGKSVLAEQIGFFLDVDRHIDLDTQICFFPEQFSKAVDTLKPGKAIIWDEARRGLNRRRSTQEVNLEITDMLAECRQHNLFLIIVMPSFYDMDMNVAVWRTRALIHVWYDWDLSDREKPLQRGFFRFYNEMGKKNLYTNKLYRQRYDYPYLKGHCFDATFPHHYVVDEGEYRKRKREAEKRWRRQDKPQKMDVAGLLTHLQKGQYLKSGAMESAAAYLKVHVKTLCAWRVANTHSTTQEKVAT